MCLLACPGRTAASCPALGTRCDSFEGYLRHGVAGFGGLGRAAELLVASDCTRGLWMLLPHSPFWGGPSSNLQGRVHSKLLVVMASTKVNRLVTLKPSCPSIWIWLSSDPVYMALTKGCRWHFGFASTAFLHVLTSMVKFSPGERPEEVGGFSEEV